MSHHPLTNTSSLKIAAAYPTPSLASQCVLPRGTKGEGDTFTQGPLGGEEVPIRTTGEKALYSVYSVQLLHAQ
jgi:hypothetical protein